MLNFDLRYAEQFLVALVLTSLTVLAHSIGMNLVRHYFRRSYSSAEGHKSSRSYIIIMIGIVAIMMATHAFEVVIWSGYYMVRGIVPDAMAAMNFSINSYTTLGASYVTLPIHWRGLGAFESMAGMLMFGWSTAVLAAVIVKLHSLDA